MNKVDFYVGVEFNGEGDYLDTAEIEFGRRAIHLTLVNTYGGYTRTPASGIYEDFPIEAVEIYTVLQNATILPADARNVAEILAIAMKQKSVLFFITKGEGGFS